MSQLSKLALTFPSQADLSFILFFRQGNFTDLLKRVLNKGETYNFTLAWIPGWIFKKG